MITLKRRDPFGHLRYLERESDSFRGAQSGPFFSWSAYQCANSHILLDVYEDDDNFAVKAAVPGINPDDLDVSITNNVLAIKGEIKTEDNVSENSYLYRERSYGSFQRNVTLRPDLDINKAATSYENGVLTINFPKKEICKPKTLKINMPNASGGKPVK